MVNAKVVLGIIGVLVVAFTSGCANLQSIHRKLDVNEGKGVLVDIKQRAILVRNKEVDGKMVPIVCAEPSPDALSVLASAFTGKVEVKEVNVALGSQTQESGSFVGLRTQSIQLLRDFLYRDCEAYMNGVIDKYQYDLLMRRNQKYMVALLGVEQLTGAVTATASNVSSQLAPPNNDSGSNAGEKKDGTKDGTKGDKDPAAGGTSDPPASGTSDPPAAGADDGKKEGAKVAKKAKKPKTAAKASKEPAAPGKDPKDPKDPAAPGKDPKDPKEPTSPAKESDPPKGTNMDSVASTVGSIVTQILQTDDIGQSCFAYLAGNATDKIPNSDLGKICKDYLEEVAKRKAKMGQDCLDIVKKYADTPGVTIVQVMDFLKILKDSPICKEPPPAMQLR